MVSLWSLGIKISDGYQPWANCADRFRSPDGGQVDFWRNHFKNGHELI
jgi:hypothetical protein